MNAKPELRYLFQPRGVAVVGASSNSDKIGYKIVDNIVSGGYQGRIYPINPKGGELLSLPVFPSLQDVNGLIDLAVIVVPARGVVEAVQACAAKNVKFITIISSGFAEIGKADLETQIANYARSQGMRVLGPNVFGIYSSRASLNATFGPKRVKKGRVAIVTQSGALGIAMMGRSVVESVGLSAMVSVGNKADLDEGELIEYLVNDEETRLVLLYVEGMPHGERFVETVRKATKTKPVLVIKSGRSSHGAAAVASHTGSLAGSDAVFDAVMRQCGVIRAENLRDAFGWCKFLDYSKPALGPNTVIITNGGGIGVLATDACEKYGVYLYEDLAVLRASFSKVTPAFGSVKNPVDLTGEATPSTYQEALNAGLDNDNIHAVIGLFCQTAVFDGNALEAMIADAYQKYTEKGKPIVFTLLGGELVESSILALSNRGIPIFSEVYEAISCLGVAFAQSRHMVEPHYRIEEAQIDAATISQITRAALEQKRFFLLPQEARAIMDAAHIGLPVSRVARTIDEAVQYAEEIGFPVVMKVVSRDIVHKSDAGGVALDLDDAAEVMDAYQAIMSSCREHAPHAVVEGVEIGQMVLKGTEIIVGARRDPSFGPVVMCGLGGVYVEVLKEVAFGVYPLSRREAMSMIKQTKAYQILLGARGEERKDIEAVIETLLVVGAIVKQCKDISDIEINPIMVYESGAGVKAIDVRILLSKSQETA
jgi:acetate---CoA ligase (ADP-forming)